LAAEASHLAESRNRRVVLVVAVAALAAAVAVIGATLLQTRGERTSLAARQGRPPLELAFGVAGGPEARALARAQALYDRGDLTGAEAIFARYDSPAARVGASLAAWHDGRAVGTLEQLAARYPQSALVALQLGWAYYWVRRNTDAAGAWRRAARLGPDSPYGVDAEDILHSNFKIPGLPPIVTGLALPPKLANLPAAAQLQGLRRAAARHNPQAKLLYGSALWTLEHPLSAEREFAAAARLAPRDAVARAAAASALFSKANPVRAFAHLGPLTAVFPHSAAVEFQLGVLLLYIGQRAKSVEHLRAAVADGPQSPYAKPAKTLLASLAHTRSK
jgi:tetratricopeptide (TPR) repeat protein